MENLESEIYLGRLADIAVSIQDYGERISVRLDQSTLEKDEHLAEVIGYLQLIRQLTNEGMKELRKL